MKCMKNLFHIKVSQSYDQEENKYKIIIAIFFARKNFETSDIFNVIHFIGTNRDFYLGSPERNLFMTEKQAAYLIKSLEKRAISSLAIYSPDEEKPIYYTKEWIEKFKKTGEGEYGVGRFNALKIFKKSKEFINELFNLEIETYE